MLIKYCCVVLVFLVWLPTSTVSFFFKSSLTLEPYDPIACTTQNVTFVCTSSKSDVNLMLRVGGNVVPDSEIRRDSETNISYTLQNISEDNQNNDITCIDRLDDFNFQSTILRVYTMPAPITLQQCVVYNYDNYMKCVFDLGTTFTKDILPNITCYFRYHDYSASWTPCPQHRVDEGTSQMTINWTSIYNGFIQFGVVEFNFTVNSQCDVSRGDTMTIDTTYLIKPDPVKNLKVVSVNATCITLSWKSHEPQHNKIHRITYKSKWNTHFQMENFTVLEDSEHPILWPICDLHPYTSYDVDVQVMPLQGGYWSDPVSLTNTTHETAPAKGPEFIEGIYRWDLEDCVRGHTRDVILYWKPIDEFYHMGRLIGYEISIKPVGKVGEGNSKDIPIGSPPDHYSVLVRALECALDYDITITARTSVGFSPIDSSITVPSFYSGIHVNTPAFIVEVNSNISGIDGSSQVEIRWPEIPGDYKQSISSYKICTCRKAQGYCKQNVPLECKVEPGNIVMSMLNKDGPDDYRYGVAIFTNNASRGIQWQSCLYSKYNEPTQKPNNLSVEVNNDEANSIVVFWKSLQCVPGQPYIASYDIEYCPVKVTGRTCEAYPASTSRVTVSPGGFKIAINDLTKDQLYSFRIQGVTADGKRGPYSEAAYQTAVNNKLTAGTITGIVFGGLFILVCAAAGIFFVCRNWVQAAKSEYKMRANVELPKFFEDDNLCDGKNGCDKKAVEGVDGYMKISDDTDILKEEEKKKQLKRQESKDSGVVDPPSPTSPPTDYVLHAGNASSDSTSDIKPLSEFINANVHVQPSDFSWQSKKATEPFQKKTKKQAPPDGYVLQEIREKKEHETDIGNLKDFSGEFDDDTSNDSYHMATKVKTAVIGMMDSDNTARKEVIDNEDTARKEVDDADETKMKTVDKAVVQDSGYTESESRKSNSESSTRPTSSESIGFYSIEEYRKAGPKDSTDDETAMKLFADQTTAKIVLKVIPTPIGTNAEDIDIDERENTSNSKLGKSEDLSEPSNYLRHAPVTDANRNVHTPPKLNESDQGSTELLRKQEELNDLDTVILSRIPEPIFDTSAAPVESEVNPMEKYENDDGGENRPASSSYFTERHLADINLSNNQRIQPTSSFYVKATEANPPFQLTVKPLSTATQPKTNAQYPSFPDWLPVDNRTDSGKGNNDYLDAHMVQEQSQKHTSTIPKPKLNNDGYVQNNVFDSNSKTTTDDNIFELANIINLSGTQFENENIDDRPSFVQSQGGNGGYLSEENLKVMTEIDTKTGENGYIPSSDYISANDMRHLQNGDSGKSYVDDYVKGPDVALVNSAVVNIANDNADDSVEDYGARMRQLSGTDSGHSSLDQGEFDNQDDSGGSVSEPNVDSGPDANGYLRVEKLQMSYLK